MLQINDRCRKEFGNYLREIRIALHTNIKDTAELIGILPNRLSDYERYKILPTQATMRKITKAFGALGVHADSLRRLEELHTLAIAHSNNRVIGRVRRES